MMMNALILCLLSSVAVATTTTSKVQSDMVGKVVKLLQDMKADLEKEEKQAEDNYDKLMCWCETNTKEKTQSVDDAEVAITSLTSEIESRTARAERLKKDIADHEAGATKLLESIAAAEAQRDKEGKANQASIVDLTKNLQMLKGAIIVLKKHQATEFPQIKVSLFQKDRPSAIDKLDKFMDSHDYGHLTAEDKARVDTYEKQQREKFYGGYTLAELQTLQYAKKLVKSFAQVNTKGNTGEIFGILTTMQEQMAEDLKETEEKEAQAVKDFDAMMADLKAQLATEEENAKRKTAEAGENGRALSAAKTGLEDNENTLASDTDFLANVKKTCGDMDEQFAAQRKTRKEEILAVSEAIGILTEEESNEENAEQQEGAAFIQMRSVRQRSTVRLLAAKMLQRTAQKTGNANLLALSASVQLDGFVKVKKAINDMIADLKQEQKDEVKHKDFCQSEMHANEMETMEKVQEEKDLNAALNLLADEIAALKKDIETTKAEIAQGKVDLQQANMDRVEESQAFINTVSEQRAAKVVLNKALARLEEFYGRRGVDKDAAFLQRRALLGGKHKQTPPVKIEAYKKSSGAGPVVTMLENIIHETSELEAEAQRAEQEAQTNYEQFVKESNASQKAKEEAVVNMGEQLAGKEQESVGKTEDLAGNKQEQEALAGYLGDLHKSCDFVLKNFDLRQEARGAEIEALGQALAILSGA